LGLFFLWGGHWVPLNYFFDDVELVIWQCGIGNLANMDLATWQCGLDKWLKWDAEPAFWQNRLCKYTWQNSKMKKS